MVFGKVANAAGRGLHHLLVHQRIGAAGVGAGQVAVKEREHIAEVAVHGRGDRHHGLESHVGGVDVAVLGRRPTDTLKRQPHDSDVDGAGCACSGEPNGYR